MRKSSRFPVWIVVAVLAAVMAHANMQASASAAADTPRLAAGEHYAMLGDVNLHYVVAGDGPLLIVCSPGWGPGSIYLQRGLAPLEKEYKLVFVDTRGSGKSSRPADIRKMSGADMADDIEQLRKYFGLASIRLLGHSDSGSIVLDYAERYPDGLEKLIIVDGVIRGWSPETRARMKQMKQDLSKDPRYESAIRATWATDSAPPSSDDELSQILKDTLALNFADPHKNIPMFVQSQEGTVPSSWAFRSHADANRAHEWHQQEQLGNVRAKTLIIVGKEDWNCPAFFSEQMHAGIHDSELVEIDGSGHFPWIEQPADFFPAVSRFLALK
jgi:proline iminopeptidase